MVDGAHVEGDYSQNWVLPEGQEDLWRHIDPSATDSREPLPYPIDLEKKLCGPGQSGVFKNKLGKLNSLWADKGSSELQTPVLSLQHIRLCFGQKGLKNHRMPGKLTWTRVGG